VEDLVRALYRQGFRRMLVLNGHGGNDPVRGRLYEIANALPDLRITWYAWWQSHTLEPIFLKHGLKPAHANWLEAFDFTRVADLPEGEKTPPHVVGLLGAEEARQVYGDGSFGGPYQAEGEVMREIFDACLGDVVGMLRFEE